MKHLKINLLTVFMLISFISTAQEKGDIITLDVPTATVNVEPLMSGKTLTNNATYLKAGVKFKVISKNDTLVKLQALNFNKLTQTQKTKYLASFDGAEATLSEIYNNKIYMITRSDFDANAKKYEPKERFSVGLLTLPFKARPQDDFSFDTEFNISSTLNIRLYEIAGSTFNYQIGAGIGSVGLNTSNASGLGEDEAQDVATLTLLNGLMLQYNRVQVGLYAGVDFINNQKNYDWESNGNLWLGFGIGYSLFDIAVSKETSKQ